MTPKQTLIANVVMPRAALINSLLLELEALLSRVDSEKVDAFVSAVNTIQASNDPFLADEVVLVDGFGTLSTLYGERFLSIVKVLKELEALKSNTIISEVVT